MGTADIIGSPFWIILEIVQRQGPSVLTLKSTLISVRRLNGKFISATVRLSHMERWEW